VSDRGLGKTERMTTADSPRPTQSLPQVLLDSMDDIVAKLMSRLDGIDDVEYRWEPVANMWSARATNDEGSEAIIDLDPDRDIDPAPVTTIAWRLWHLTSDCFADYTARFAGETAVPDDLSWTLRADEALDRFEASWRKFRATSVRGIVTASPTSRCTRPTNASTTLLRSRCSATSTR